MRICIIGTNIFPLPPKGYSGIEYLCFHLAEGLAKRGHQVTVVAPDGSQLSEGIELIATTPREEEEASWQRYRGRLEAGEWEVILDSSWQRWSMVSSIGRDPQLPIVLWHHSDPSVYASSPAVQYPMWVGLSRDHAARLGRHFRLPVRWIWNGIDTEFYKANGKPRGSRYLWIARYTPEKGAAEVISLAKKLHVGLDLYGDTEIVSGQDYVRRCFQEADGLVVRANTGITREQTVEQYSTHKGMLYWLNWEEPFGLSVVESMATGCVPIVSRSGAIPELIQDGVTGFLVDDLDQMEALIRREAWKDINLDAMRQHIEANFSLTPFVGRWERLLLDVVAGSRW